MKEQKMAMCIGLRGYPTTYTEAAPHQSYARTRFLLFDFEISFRLTSAALLLVSTLAVIGSLYFVTDRTVCNKSSNFAPFSGCF